MYLFLFDCTHNGVSVNPPFPNLDMRNLTRTKLFLILKPLKPIIHVLFHSHLVRSKGTWLGSIWGGIPIKVNFGPVHWEWTSGKARRLRRKVTPSEMGLKRKRSYQQKMPPKVALILGEGLKPMVVWMEANEPLVRKSYYGKNASDETGWRTT